MPNYNYQAGRATEYAIRKRMKREGYLEVLRTAGSHGFADLVGIHKDGSVHFVQCKRVETKKDAEKIIKGFKASPGICAGKYEREIIIYIKKERTYVNYKL